MRKVIVVMLGALMMGCASCPFVDQKGRYQKNSKWVSWHWVPFFGGGIFPEPQLGCEQARGLGHPEWHRLPSSIVNELIKTGELDKKNRYDTYDTVKSTVPVDHWYYHIHGSTQTHFEEPYNENKNKP